MIKLIKKYLERKRRNSYIKGYESANNYIVTCSLGIQGITELRNKISDESDNSITKEFVDGWRKACDSAINVKKRNEV